MIFVTVGTDMVFDRMIKAVDSWAARNPGVRILAQIGLAGVNNYHPQTLTEKLMLPPEEYNRYCSEADLIIAHAGMGSIITALNHRKPIVLFPRLAKYGEHRNDHQLATAEKFKSRQGIFIAHSTAEIDECIKRAQEFAAREKMDAFDEFAPKEFTDKIAQFINNV